MSVPLQLGSFLASIPSPPGNALHLGPLQLRAYGAVIGIGIVIAVVIAQRRWSRLGGDPDDIVALVLWAVPAGVIGARIYHVLTALPLFEGQWWKVVAIWEGGLGIFGGLVGGTATALWVAHRRNLSIPGLLDSAAPALPVAQAIGRWGNWFNQELYGRPTDLPWGLEIDPAHRPSRFADEATFHPTFLYESLWNLTLALILIRIGRTGRLRRGHLFALYIAGYATGRILVESFRIDPTEEVGGIRVNFLVAGTALVVALLVVAIGLIRRRPDRVESVHDDAADEGEVVAEVEPVAVAAETGPSDGQGDDADPG